MAAVKIRVGALLLALVLWELAGHQLTGRAALMTPLPSGILRALVTLTLDGTLPVALLRSALRVALGSGVAVAVGVPLGALVAAAPRLGPALDAPLRVLRPVPPVAWVPLTLVWFGVTELQQVVVLAFAATLVVASGTARAVAGVPPNLVLAARNLGITGSALGFRLRAASPGVWLAVREAVGTAWFVLVAAELLAASPGLGVLILEGRDMLDPARSFVGMLALAACGVGSDALLRRLSA